MGVAFVRAHKPVLTGQQFQGPNSTPDPVYILFEDFTHVNPGDEVLVTRRDGMVAVFAGESVGRYPKDDFPTELVYGTTDHAALRLITCGGTFDSSSRHYRDNVVVFADLVDSYQAPRGS